MTPELISALSTGLFPEQKNPGADQTEDQQGVCSLSHRESLEMLGKEVSSADAWHPALTTRPLSLGQVQNRKWPTEIGSSLVGDGFVHVRCVYRAEHN